MAQPTQFFQLLNPCPSLQENQKVHHSKLNKTIIKLKKKTTTRKLSFKFVKMLTSHSTLANFKTLEFHSLSAMTFYTSTWTSHMPVGEPPRDPVGQQSARSPSSSSSSSSLNSLSPSSLLSATMVRLAPTRVHCRQGGVTMVNKVLVAMETLFCSNRLVQMFEFWTGVPPHQSTWFVCISCCFSCVWFFFFF